MHVIIGKTGSGTPAVSMQIAALRGLLAHASRHHKGHADSEEKNVFLVEDSLGVKRYIPLVIEVHNADIMASLINLKKETDEELGGLIKWTFAGATEAHLLAKEITNAAIGVIVTPSRPYPGSWDTRRM